MKKQKRYLILGAGGMIGHQMVKRLKKEGHWVRGVDLVHPEFSSTEADEFIIGDLRKESVCKKVITSDIDVIIQYAAELGGAQYVFTGENDAEIMHNSALINLNVANVAAKKGIKNIAYSSSACVYPAYNQTDPNNPNCEESSAVPAEPDSCYGWEKLFSEFMYDAFSRNKNINISIMRYHNIFSEECDYYSNRAKAPAALCRKVAEAKDGTHIEIFGDGSQTRSFLYIDDCLEGTLRLIESGFKKPLNIGSTEMVTINDLAKMIIDISGKKLEIKHIPGPIGVMGRNSDNKLIKKVLGWEPQSKLRDGIEKLYKWVNQQVNKS
jgi:nucleoside-diphosphate-sugar epimerase